MNAELIDALKAENTGHIKAYGKLLSVNADMRIRIAQLEAALRLCNIDCGELHHAKADRHESRLCPVVERINALLGSFPGTPAEQQERALVTCKHEEVKTRDRYGTYWCDVCKGILTDEYAVNRGGDA
jgi:hypothetical protein